MIDLSGNEEMRYLGWKQPYASLMLPPFNKIETRTWDTQYRGLVLITASKASYDREQLYSISGNDEYYRICGTIDIDDCLCGYAIAVGRLVNSRPMTPTDSVKCYVEYRKPWEVVRKNGTKKIQRLYCHIYEDVIPIQPIEIKGAQGWRKLSPEFIKTIQLL